MTWSRTRRAAAALLCAALACAGCGAPTSGTSRVDDESIPYGLLSPSPMPTLPTEEPTARPGDGDAQVYFVGAGDVLVPVTIAVTSPGVTDRVTEVLDRLTDGPADAAPEALGTALAPDYELSVAEVVGDTAYIDLTLTSRQPAADQIPLAIGQLVLSVTSVSGITRLALLIDGEPVDVALPGGQRTPGPVTARQYQELTRPPA